MNIRELIKQIEPRKWPGKDPDEILRDEGWDDRLIGTFRGRILCFRIAAQKLMRAVWEAFTHS